MILNDKEVVAIELFGKGYRSGAVARHVSLVTKDFYEENIGLVEDYTPYFHKLDGKHSEVQGEVLVHYEAQDIAEALAGATDNWMIWESLFYNSKSPTFAALEESEALEAMCSMKKTTTVTLGDVVITLEN